MSRYRLMAAESARFPVKLMARTLGVSRSGYYGWLGRPAPEDPWKELRSEVERAWLASKKRFGARSILASLPSGFEGTTLYRVRKLMRELGIRGVHPNKSKRTTVADPDAPERPDLIQRGFDSPVPTVKLVGDITYLRTDQGWLYLATVIDLCTRMVVGWAMAEHMRASLCVDALRMAKSRGYVAGGAIFHSDRGSQYTSKLLADWAAANGVRLSVGRTGSCHDNAVAESFFASLKNEMYSLRKWATRAEARHAVVEYVEAFYNRARPHSTIGYQIPAEKMGAFFKRTEARCKEFPMAA